MAPFSARIGIHFCAGRPKQNRPAEPDPKPCPCDRRKRARLLRESPSPGTDLTCENLANRNCLRKYFLRFLWPLAALTTSRGANTETPALSASLRPGASVSLTRAIPFERQFTRADLNLHALGSRAARRGDAHAARTEELRLVYEYYSRTA